MKSHNICIISGGFPTPAAPSKYTFVDQLACAFADAGQKITVISPVGMFKEFNDRKAFYKDYWIRETDKGNRVEVFHPRFISMSSKKVGFVNTGVWTIKAFISCVESQLLSLTQQPDIIYSHFLVPGGCSAALLGKKFAIPSFAAFGESSLWSVNSIGIGKTQHYLKDITGIVSVSTENKRILIENELCDANKIKVLPNGVNHSLFYPRDKIAMRKKYGFQIDSVIGIYTGSFSNGKGAMRVRNATDDLDGIKMIYIGSGGLEPSASNIVYKGITAHEQVPELLSAADFFVLPTLAEGCCNAIIEAMACGLPIISSDRSFNDDILSNDYAIRVDPEDVEAIRNAIALLVKDSDRRKQMSFSALEASRKFDVNKRAMGILNWMELKINETFKGV
jgi:teichuronic acid biosynthesis glycosyltransferase TuaC